MVEQYSKTKLLGKGTSGKTWLVKCRSDDSYAVVKQINLQGMTENEKKNHLREAKILEYLQHPNIIKFKEVFKTKTGRLCLVMNYEEGGDLQTVIDQQNGQLFTERQILD